MANLYETSFEEYTEANEEPSGHWADRGGNLRYNIPNHSAPYTYYDASGVRTGVKSAHVWAEKAWRWGYPIQLRLPYGEIDEKNGAWIPPNGTGRTLTNISDLIYPTGPDGVIQTVLPSQFGRYHWSHDWAYWDGAQYLWHDVNNSATWDSLVEARARLPTYELPSLSDEIYTRYYFKIKNWTGEIGVQLIRFYGMDDVGNLGYLCNINSATNEFTIYIDGVLETFVPHETIVPDVWYYLEAHYKRGNLGGVEVWFGRDGVTPTLVYSNMTLNTSATRRIHDIQIGIVDLFDYGYENSDPNLTYAAFDMYVDDWAVNPTRIGPTSGAGFPVTVNSSPNVGKVSVDGGAFINTPIAPILSGQHTIEAQQEVNV